MKTDHHEPHHDYPHGLKKANLVFSILSIIFGTLGVFMLVGIPWFIILNSYTIVNLAYHCASKHSEISYVKCRVCLNYVWFPILGVYEIYCIIQLFSGLSLYSGHLGHGDSSSASAWILIFFIVSLLLDFIQGLTYLLLI